MYFKTASSTHRRTFGFIMKTVVDDACAIFDNDSYGDNCHFYYW